ncbi:MAG: site-specific recombinase XerD [Paenibacillus sp.]|nr:site-specific recombinase XerD [Paenibacillus sp.]
MSIRRRQNKLESAENPSLVKQQLSFEDLLHSFILDCKAKNLSKEAFQAQQFPFNVYKVTRRDVKNYFIAYLFDQGKSDNTKENEHKETHACEPLPSILFKKKKAIGLSVGCSSSTILGEPMVFFFVATITHLLVCPKAA